MPANPKYSDWSKEELIKKVTAQEMDVSGEGPIFYRKFIGNLMAK
jgi:hypothetical protein